MSQLVQKKSRLKGSTHLMQAFPWSRLRNYLQPACEPCKTKPSSYKAALFADHAAKPAYEPRQSWPAGPTLVSTARPTKHRREPSFNSLALEALLKRLLGLNHLNVTLVTKILVVKQGPIETTPCHCISRVMLAGWARTNLQG